MEMWPNPRASNLSQILHDFILKKAEKLTQLLDLVEIDMTGLQFLALHLSCTKYLCSPESEAVARDHGCPVYI